MNLRALYAALPPRCLVLLFYRAERGIDVASHPSNMDSPVSPSYTSILASSSATSIVLSLHIFFVFFYTTVSAHPLLPPRSVRFLIAVALEAASVGRGREDVAVPSNSTLAVVPLTQTMIFATHRSISKFPRRIQSRAFYSFGFRSEVNY